MRRHVRLALVVLAMGAAVSPRVNAQPYCTLRDPIREIYALYPAASSYRSLVHTVDDDARRTVALRLPFELHRDELGSHTVYAAMMRDTPLGIIHARSEQSEWGLVEIAWALDLDLHVVDFHFQRCRAPGRAAVEADGFRSQFTGKSLDELRAMLSDDGQRLNAAMISVPEGADDLAAAVVRSGLKTIAVTAIVWREDLERLRGEARAAANAAAPRSN